MRIPRNDWPSRPVSLQVPHWETISPIHLKPDALEKLELGHLRGRRTAVVVFSHYPSDPRPRRATEILVRLGMELEVISIEQSNDEPRRETFNGVSILRVPLKRQRGGKFRARVHDVFHSAILQGRKIPKEIGASTAAAWLSDNICIPPAGVEHGRNVVSILERAPAPVTLDRPD